MSFRCGHETTEANTTVMGKCRTCFNAYHNNYAKKKRQGETPAKRSERYRLYYLPRQLEAARRKVVHLEREAVRLGILQPGAEA